MTPIEAQAARDKAEALLRAHEMLKVARARLALINAHAKAGKSWDVSICLQRAERYSGNTDVTITIRLPIGVVQQQAIDAVRAASRAVCLLGGTP